MGGAYVLLYTAGIAGIAGSREQGSGQQTEDANKRYHGNYSEK